jgi:hypothetical protein
MDFPLRSTKGFPGKREEAYLAGMIPITFKTKIVNYLSKNINLKCMKIFYTGYFFLNLIEKQTYINEYT